MVTVDKVIDNFPGYFFFGVFRFYDRFEKVKVVGRLESEVLAILKVNIAQPKDFYRVSSTLVPDDSLMRFTTGKRIFSSA